MSTNNDQSGHSLVEIQQLIEDTHLAIANARRFLGQLASDSRAIGQVEEMLVILESHLAELHAKARRFA